MFIHQMGYFALFLSLVLSSGAFSEQNLECHSRGGGYLTQGLKVTSHPSRGLILELERFSPVPDIVPNQGLKVEGQLVKRFSTVLPQSLCRFRSAPDTNFSLFSCSNGVTKILAELELLDGTHKTLVLPDNFSVVATQVRMDKVSKFSSYTALQVTLGTADTGVFFLARECK